MVELNNEEEVPTAPWWMWLLLVFVAAVSFWCQATVTEERFVPALNVIANKFRIPDDIAGATLMAAGASSPELFSSIVALFITHSSLGLGTVFGSEVFNQLIICAGAVYSSKTGRLELNKAVLAREVFFYALGILALYLALQDTKPVDEDPSGIDHIFINFPNAVMVFGGYIFYVIVCANMDSIVAMCGFWEDSSNDRRSTRTTYGSIQQGEIIVGEDLPFLQEASGLISEPAQNFETVEFHRTKFGFQSDADFSFSEEAAAASTQSAAILSKQSDSTLSTNGRSLLEEGIRNAVSKYSDGANLRPFRFLMSNEKPSDDHGLLDVEENTVRLESRPLGYLTNLSCLLGHLLCSCVSLTRSCCHCCMSCLS